MFYRAQVIVIIIYGSYARTTRFVHRYKYIRIKKNYQQAKYIEDVSSLPFGIIYGIEDPNEKLEVL